LISRASDHRERERSWDCGIMAGMKRPRSRPDSMPSTTDPVPRRPSVRELDEAALERVIGGNAPSGNKVWSDDWLAPV
jgi:hypothetical protein